MTTTSLLNVSLSNYNKMMSVESIIGVHHQSIMTGAALNLNSLAKTLSLTRQNNDVDQQRTLVLSAKQKQPHIISSSDVNTPQLLSGNSLFDTPGNYSSASSNITGGMSAEDLLVLNFVNLYVHDILGFIIFTCGIIFNILSFTYFQLSRSFRDTSMRHYFSVLSVTDSLHLSEWLFTILMDRKIILLNEKICRIFLFTTITSGHISIWLLVFLSIERYIILQFPFRGKQFYTIKNSLRMLCAVIVILLLIDLPYLFPGFITNSTSHYELHLYSCEASPIYIQYMFVNNVLIYSLIPFFILLIFNCLLISLLAKQKNQLFNIVQGENAVLNAKRERQFKERTILLILVTFFLVVTVSPRYGALMLTTTNYGNEIVEKHLINYLTITKCLIILEMLNFSINFLFYIICSKTSRAELYLILYYFFYWKWSAKSKQYVICNHLKHHPNYNSKKPNQILNFNNNINNNTNYYSGYYCMIANNNNTTNNNNNSYHIKNGNSKKLPLKHQYSNGGCSTGNNSTIRLNSSSINKRNNNNNNSNFINSSNQAINENNALLRFLNRLRDLLLIRKKKNDDMPPQVQQKQQQQQQQMPNMTMMPPQMSCMPTVSSSTITTTSSTLNNTNVIPVTQSLTTAAVAAATTLVATTAAASANNNNQMTACIINDDAAAAVAAANIYKGMKQKSCKWKIHCFLINASRLRSFESYRSTAGGMTVNCNNVNFLTNNNNHHNHNHNATMIINNNSSIKSIASSRHVPSTMAAILNNQQKNDSQKSRTISLNSSSIKNCRTMTSSSSPSHHNQHQHAESLDIPYVNNNGNSDSLRRLVTTRQASLNHQHSVTSSVSAENAAINNNANNANKNSDSTKNQNKPLLNSSSAASRDDESPEKSNDAKKKTMTTSTSQLNSALSNNSSKAAAVVSMTDLSQKTNTLSSSSSPSPLVYHRSTFSSSDHISNSFN